MPMTSILVPVFNNLNILAYMLNTLTTHTRTHAHEIILVDNHSTEAGAEEALQQLARHPRVQLLRNGRNEGFGKANNQALAASRGEVLVLLNSDMFVTGPWLAPLLERLHRQPSCGAVQAKIVLPDEQSPPHLWPTQTVGAHFDHQGLPQYYLDGIPRQDARVNQPLKLQAFMGTGVAMRREVVEKTGFFDEAYDLVFLEDSDLSLRISAAGYEIWYEPASEICHFHSASMVHLSQEEYDRSRLGNLALFRQKWPAARIAAILEGQGLAMG